MKNSSKNEIIKLKEILNGEFEMKDIGEAKRIVYMYIMRSHKKSELFIYQSSDLKKVVERFRMQDAKTINTHLDHHTKLSIK